MPAVREYRPSIDGLRAIAVLGVFLFHLERRWLPGGFLGVDIFFAISGYLITSIILRDCEGGRFEFRRFYQRRIARLLPAFTVVALATMAGAAFIYSPQDLASAGATLSAAAASAANLKFLLQGNYFQLSPDGQPFLHCWSLSVEEQFYLLFPAALVLLSRRKAALVGAFAVSLVGYLAVDRLRPEWAFYLLPTRAWELLAGSILACGCTAPWKVHPLPFCRDSVDSPFDCTYGVATAKKRFADFHHLLWPAGPWGTPLKVSRYGWTTPLRSWLCRRSGLLGLVLIGISFAMGRYTILPVAGAVCLLRGDSRLLTWKPLVAVGRMSYSLYLWHWPVFSLVDYQLYWQPTVIRMAWKIALSAGAAALSFYWIEQPGRILLNRPASRRLAYGALAASLATLVPLGLAVRSANYVNADARTVRNGGRRLHWQGRKGSIVLMGDSNGSMYGKMAAELAEERDLRLSVLSVEAGDPLPRTSGDDPQLWRDSLAAVRQERPDYLVLVCNWEKLRDDRSRLPLALRELRPYARTILLITQPPILPSGADRESIRNGSRPPFVEDVAERGDRVARNEFVKSAQGDNVRVIDVEPLFARAGGEIRFIDEHHTLLYQDHDHLSAAGALLVKPGLLAAMGVDLSASR